MADERSQIAHPQPDAESEAESAPPIQAASSEDKAALAVPPGAKATPVEPTRHYVHHSYIWLSTARTVLILLVIGFISLFSVISDIKDAGEDIAASAAPFIGATLASTAIVILVAVVILVVFQILSYKHLYYELDAKEFNVYRGILNKKRSHVPYQRIQSVDQRATLIQRLFGVCTVYVETAGGAANKAITIPYVSKQQAEMLRTELFARKQLVLRQGNSSQINWVQAARPVQGAGAVPDGSLAAGAGATPMPGTTASSQVPQSYEPATQAESDQNVLDMPAAIWDEFGGVFGGKQVNTGIVTYECGLSNKELILTGLSNNTAMAAVVVTVLLGIVQVVSMAVELFPSSLGAALDSYLSNPTAPDPFTAALGIGFIFFIVLFVWLVSAIATCISYGGFHVRRRDQRIEVERGLLQHQFHGVDVDRIQVITIRQSLIKRLLGYCELVVGKVQANVENSESSDQTNVSQGMVIHPFAPVKRVPEILAGLIPEYADVPTQSTPVAKVALRRALIRRGIVQGFGFWLAVVSTAALLIAEAALSLDIVPVAQANIFQQIALAKLQDPALFSMIELAYIVALVISAVIFVLDIVGAVLWYRGSSFAYNRRFMQITNGGFTRTSTSALRSKIQYGFTRTNPLQRHAHTATILVRTAAGIGGSTIRLIDATEEDAGAWALWLLPRSRETNEESSTV